MDPSRNVASAPTPSSSRACQNGIYGPRRSPRIAAYVQARRVNSAELPSVATLSLGRGYKLGGSKSNVPLRSTSSAGPSNISGEPATKHPPRKALTGHFMMSPSSRTVGKREDSNNNTPQEPELYPISPERVKTKVAKSENLKPPSYLLKNPEEGKCSFCSIDLKVGDGVMLQECLHLFCRDCLQAAIEGQKDIARIPCPISEEQKCGAFIDDAEVKELVRPEVFNEYIDRSLKIARKEMKNVFTCKTSQCEGWCEYDLGRKTFNCPRCGKINCLECKAIHLGVSCDVYQSLSSSGDHSKLRELMEKEQKSGWSQLMESMKAQNASFADMDQANGMIQKNLLLNTMNSDCPICFMEINKGEGVILQECLHIFCKGCLINLVEYNDDALVKCPYIDGNYSCICYLQACEIKALVPEAIYEKHLQRSVKLGESGIENSFHCKTPDCPGWCEYGEGARRFDCLVCGKPNCIQCGAIHEDSCEDYKNSVQQNVNDKLSEKAVEDLIRTGEYMRCPKCKIPVQKRVGCDWLQCTVCKTEICWITRGPRWGRRGHGDVSGGCRCNVNGKKCHPKCGNCH